MTEKELLSQLNNLKNIKPDNAWKRQGRDILLSQISGGYFGGLTKQEETIKGNIFSLLSSFFARPAVVVATILIVIFGGGVFSLNASRGSKPGDSLYIAKIISEKTQLAITFSEEKKAKLGIAFAGNRANEIAQILTSDNDGEKKTETVEKLTEDLKKEIISVKTRLKKINKENNSDGANEESEIFSANLGRENRGVQVYNGGEKNKDTDKENETAGVSADTLATSSKSNSEKNKNKEQDDGDIGKALSEAGELLDKKDYSSTLNKLEEVDRIVSKTENSEENKKEDNTKETATSTGK